MRNSKCLPIKMERRSGTIPGRNQIFTVAESSRRPENKHLEPHSTGISFKKLPSAVNIIIQ